MNAQKAVNVGLLGFGTVGTGVVKYLLERQKQDPFLVLKKVAVADLNKPREVDFPILTEDPRQILDDPEIQLVVELIGGESPAFQLIGEALSRGKSVVTANKVAVSRHMKALFNLARRHSVDLGFEASVAGSIPIVRVLNGFQGESITRFTGILNGTSNYILSRMEEGMDFTEALVLAQEKGYAEAEHLLDTGGFDARDKLAVIASLIYNTHVDPESIHCEGITGVTPVDLDFAAKHGLEEGEPGYSVKSLATARTSDQGLELSVYPALVRRDHPLASVRDESNGIYIEGVLSGPQLYLGRGAGRDATTSAVVSDIRRLAGNIRRGVVDDLPSLDSDLVCADVKRSEKAGYIRMNLSHRPGSIAEAARILGDHGLNIEDSIQRRRFKTKVNDQYFIPDIVTIEPITYELVAKALRAVQASERVIGEAVFLRLEE